jgi:hypothetical protein
MALSQFLETAFGRSFCTCKDRSSTGMVKAFWCFRAAANIFDLIYKGSGEIQITAKAEPPTKE